MSLYRRPKADGSFAWWARVEYKSRVYQSNLNVIGTNTKPNIKEAEKQHDLFKVRCINRGDEEAALAPAPDTLGGLKEKFFGHVTSQCSASTVHTYKYAWKFIEGEFRDILLAKIDNGLIEAFSQKLQTLDLSRGQGPAKRKANAHTVNVVLRTLRRALILAFNWNMIAKVPKITLVKNVRDREYIITPEREAKLLAHANVQMRQVIPFLIDSGLRIGEACALLWEHIDFAHNRILVRATAEHKLKTKNSKREVPMTSRVKAILKHKKEVNGSSPYVWTGRDDKSALSIYAADSAFLRLKRAAHVTAWDCVLHSCRHTFCTNLGNAGMDAYTIMRLAGHGSITISAKYVHTSETRLKEAVAALEAAASTSQPLQMAAGASE